PWPYTSDLLSIRRYAYHRALHSFPTRRSSDLKERQRGEGQQVVALVPAGAQARVGIRQQREDEHGQQAEGEGQAPERKGNAVEQDRKSTRLNSSHVKISYAVFCLKKKKNNTNR